MKITTTFLPALLALLAGACDNDDVTSDCSELIVGAGIPLSGGSEGTGQNVRHALEMARDDLNDAGGVDGSNVILQIVDDESGTDRSVVQSAAEALAGDECVVAVVGHLNSNATLWAQEVYDREEIVNFTAVSTASSIASNSEWTFRNITHNGYKGRFLAEFAQAILGIDRIGVIFDDDNFGTDLKSFFVDEAEQIDLTVLSEYAYSRTESETEIETAIERAVESLLAAGAEAIYVSGVLDEGVLAVKAVRERAGPEMPIIWSGWEEPLLIKFAGTDAEGVYVPIHRTYDDSNPDVDEFRSRFEETYGEAPGAFAPFAYDAMRMLGEAIDLAGRDRTEIREHLAGIRSRSDAYRGLTGPIYFDADGDLAVHFISALVVRQGEFVPIDE